MPTFNIETLTNCVQADAAIRRIRRLQPVGGQGTALYPPTYPAERNNDPPRHVFERRRVNGQDVLCVLIDSVQSQANRLEEALRGARDARAVEFPTIVVDFGKSEVADLGRITTLDAPHRVFDAIIRDSELKGTRFKDTDVGKRLIQAKSQNARVVYEVSPTALIFGAWNSTGEGGGLGAKFPRAVVSEIIGVNVATDPVTNKPAGQRTGSRVDPLGIRSGVRVFKSADGDWSLSPPEGKKTKDVKEVKPSEINHSNIAPTVTPLGVSVDYALHTFVLSFAALRRLQFGATADGNAAGHAVLAALGLVALVEQDARGYFLRSRCDLVPEQGSTGDLEIVRADGSTTTVSLDVKAAHALLRDAVKQAEALDLRWSDKDVVLEPQAKLVELVKRSREKALRGEAEQEATA